MEKTSFSPRLGSALRIVVAGGSNTGKSILIDKIATFRHELIDHPKPIDVLLFFYFVKEEERFQRLRSLFPQAKFYQGVSEFGTVMREHEAVGKERGVLVVLEDLQLASAKAEEVALAFTVWAHHLPLAAVVASAHSLHLRNSPVQTLINRNLTHLFLTNSPRLKSSLLIFGREMDSGEPKALLRAFEEATSPRQPEPHPYLVVDLVRADPSTCFFSNIFPGEKLKLFR